MDPALALALALDAIKLGDALLNAAIATRGAIDAAKAQEAAVRMASLKQASDELSAKLHVQLQAIIAKG